MQLSSRRGQRYPQSVPENRSHFQAVEFIFISGDEIWSNVASFRFSTITFIVCGKRHKMSFFPKEERDADRKNGNVKAGVRSFLALDFPGGCAHFFPIFER